MLTAKPITITTARPAINLLPTFTVEEEAYTRIHCTNIRPPKFDRHWHVHIHTTTYLINTKTEEKLFLLHAVNIPVAPEWYFFKSRSEILHFVLIFPQLPKDWEVFNLVEKSCGNCSCIGFKNSEIKRNNAGIYSIKVL